jgi:hypothetical protein
VFGVTPSLLLPAFAPRSRSREGATNPHYAATRPESSVAVAQEGGGACPTAGVALEPGQWVRHPAEPGWGAGQVQSVVGDRVTVNFENRGKVLINSRVVGLESLENGA